MQQPHLLKLILVSGLILSSLFAFALEEAPQSLNLDGRLFSNTSGTSLPLLDTGTLKIQILDYNGTCVLYEEEQSFDTRGSDGAFNIKVGEKSASTTKRTSGDSGNTLAKVFANNGGTIPGKFLSNGSACVGNATAGYERSVLITVIADSDPTPKAMTPFALSSVPSALVAERAESLEGIKSSGFLQVKSTAPYSLSQANLENIFSTVNYAKLTDLLSGSSSLYIHSTANGTIQTPAILGTPASPTAGQLWYDSGVIKYWNGSSAQTLSAGSGITSLTIGAGLTPTGTISSGGQTIAVDTGTTAGKIVAVQTGGKLPALDGSDLTNVTASAFSSTGSISTSGSISANAANFRALTLTNAGTQTITLNPAASITGSPISFTLPAAMPGANGYVLSSTTAGVMSWIAPASGGLASVSNTASLANGKVWVGDAGGLAQEKFISIADIRSTVAGNAQFFPTSCTAGQTLTWQSGTDTMICSNISLATSALTGDVDLTTQVTGTLPVANGGTNSSTTLNNNRLMISSGSAIVEASAMTDGQMVVGKTGSAPQLVSLTGDLTMSNAGAAKVVAIQNTAVSATAPTTTGQVLRNVSGTWTPGFLSMFDLRSTVTGTAAFGGIGCLSNQTLTWTAATDNLSCTNIAISNTAVSGLGVAATLGIGAGLTTSSGNIVADFGTGSGKIVQGNDARLPSSICASGNKMRWDGSAWQCETDLVTGTVAIANGGTGATTQAGAANAILPSQSGQGGKFLTTDGSNASWGTPAAGGGLTYVAVSTATHTVTSSDNNKFFYVTVGSTISLPAVAGLSDGFHIVVKRMGIGNVIIDPSGSETIDDQATRTMRAQYDLVSLVKIGTLWTVDYFVSNDPCDAYPGIGAPCAGGALYVGVFNYGSVIGAKRVMVTPSGCTDSSTPTCAGGPDTVSKQWATASGAHGNGTSMSDGAANTAAQAGQAAVVASKFCSNMVYGGYDDWYLPALEEVQWIFSTRTAIGAYPSGSYWTSTQVSNTNAYGGGGDSTKTFSTLVRCVRRY